MQTTGIEIDWDGEHLPKELAELPPGRYQLFLVNDGYELSEEEEAAVLEGIAAAEAGDVIPYDEVMRELRARYT